MYENTTHTQTQTYLFIETTPQIVIDFEFDIVAFICLMVDRIYCFLLILCKTTNSPECMELLLNWICILFCKRTQVTLNNRTWLAIKNIKSNFRLCFQPVEGKVGAIVTERQNKRDRRLILILYQTVLRKNIFIPSLVVTCNFCRWNGKW